MLRQNPPAIAADTPVEVWKRQMAAIAARSIEQRLAEWEAFNREMSRAEAGAVRRRHPDYDDGHVLRALVRHRYGDRLTRGAWPHEPLLDP